VATRTLHPIHFEDFSGVQFERLVFAYHVRAGWTNLVWLGQSGSDRGRDILGTEAVEFGASHRVVIQCVNRESLTLEKAKGDMEKATQAMPRQIDAFKFVCGGAVSAAMREKIRLAAAALDIRTVTIWSGVEFEENLRLRGEYLLRRFMNGEEFPESEAAIQMFVDDFPGLADEEALKLMAAVFDRPAFRTPFREESSLPAFQRAIEDTISALSTGTWRTRDGTEIRRVPSVHHLKDPRTQKVVKEVIERIDGLRRLFVARLRDGGIQHCGCREPDCPVYTLPIGICGELDAARRRALDLFRTIHASFDVTLR